MTADITQEFPKPKARAKGRALSLNPRLVAAVSFFAQAVLKSYAQVIFSGSAWLGGILLLATFVVPSVGAVGLVGVVLSIALALALQMDREAVRSGILGYNALLVFLAIGATLQHSGAFWGLAAVAAGLVVLTHAALSGAMSYHFRLPVLSLPFVAVAWLLQGAVPHIRGMSVGGHPPALDLGAFPGPELLDTLLRALGAMFFQPHWTAGLLVLGALMAYSRIAVVHALVGFGMAVFADQLLFSFPADYLHLYIGFNFIMTAVAVGGIYYVPSFASLALAAFASLGCGLVSVGLLSWLQPVGLAVLAAPFNATVLILLYALGQRQRDASPRSVDVPGHSPEESLNHYRTRVQRFRSSLPVALKLPFRGAWLCTQGNNGDLTHQGAWRHGLDFEVADKEGRRYRGHGRALTDWLCYGLPIIAPAAGTVVKVVDGVPDNPIGHVNTEANWGNLVLLKVAPDLFCLLAHLGNGSVSVREGDVVAQGQTLGLCGSSGRSPVPHLHVQLQSTPVVGNATSEIRFHGVAVEGAQGGDPAAPIEHLPGKGEKVRNLEPSKELAAALQMPVGLSYVMRVLVGADSEPDEARTETIRSEIDLLGNRSLLSVETGARLYFEVSAERFVIYDYVGPEDSGLYALYCALCKVPLDDAPELVWEDYLNPRRLSRSPLAWLMDAASPFVATADQRIAYLARRRGGRLRITGEAPRTRPWQADVKTECSIRPGVGLEWVQVRVGSHVVEATWNASA